MSDKAGRRTFNPFITESLSPSSQYLMVLGNFRSCFHHPYIKISLILFGTSKSSTPPSLPGERIELRTAVIGSFLQGWRRGEKLYSIKPELWILAPVLTIYHWLNNLELDLETSVCRARLMNSDKMGRGWSGAMALILSTGVQVQRATILSSLS